MKCDNVNKLCVGAASVDITPPLCVPYLSGNPRHAPFTGVHDNLRVSAAVISNGHKTVAIVSMDSIGFDNAVLGKNENYTAYVRRLICQRCPITPQNVLVSAGHIHSTPDMLNFRDLSGFKEAKPWFKTIARRTAEAVELAFNSMSPATMKYKKCDVEGIAINRRDEKDVDNQLITLLFECENGANVVIGHFACHPVIVQAQPLVSADYVGVMRQTVEKGLPNSTFLLLQGFAGDINPAVGDKGSFEQVHQVGAALGEAALAQALALLDETDWENDCRLDVLSGHIMLPSRELPEGDALLPYADDEDAQVRMAEGTPEYPCELQVLRIGRCVIMGAAGELFCGAGLRLKHSLPGEVCMPTGYANGYVGYVCPHYAFENGGYETEVGPWSKVGPEAHEIIINKLTEIYILMEEQGRSKQQ